MRLFRPVIMLLAALAILAAPRSSVAQVSVGVSINLAPPALPVYVQPPLPAPGYLWTPGYWAYGPVGYYWVPGTWVLPPAVGLLWTPGYWGWRGGGYFWNAGYWGPHVGFYGGINYGFGYNGRGYFGGRWTNGAFAYNSAVNNVHNVNVTHVYRQTVNNTTVNRVSFNGGTGGTAAQPTAQQQAFAREQHMPATTVQTQHEQAAGSNHASLASVNHGRPAVAATSRAGAFSGPGIVAARGPAIRPAGGGPNGHNGTAHAPATPPHPAAHPRPPGGGEPHGRDEHHE